MQIQIETLTYPKYPCGVGTRMNTKNTEVSIFLKHKYMMSRETRRRHDGYAPRYLVKYATGNCRLLTNFCQYAYPHVTHVLKHNLLDTTVTAIYNTKLEASQINCCCCKLLARMGSNPPHLEISSVIHVLYPTDDND